MIRTNSTRVLATLVALLLAALALAGCSGKQPPASTPPPATASNDPDPHWAVRQNPPAKVALVYVHGVIGDMVGTWTAENGKTFFGLVDEHEATHGKADAFVFGFPSYLFKGGSFDIREAANRLHLRLQTQGVLNYPAIVFVAHSMGGLVVMRELLTHRELLPKVPVVVFYATPMEGSLVAAIGKQFSPNSALAQMTDADANALLQTLDDEWKSIPNAGRPHIRCAYEKTTVGPLKIVPWTSATRLCEGATPAIEADHISIVKPDRPGADAILVLVDALNEYVLNKNLEAKLETPDFTTEGDSAVFVLHDALGKQQARLHNAGGTPLNFTLAEISDPRALLLWPDNTPQDIEPHDTVDLGVALSRAATATEYHFILRTSVAPDRTVIVRIPDLAAAKAQQAAVARAVAADIEAVLADPQQNQPFLAATADSGDAPEAIVQLAHRAVARQAPDLPNNAQWVLTADLLNATNWSTLAARALRNAEKIAPSTPRNPGVQYLAGIVAAQAGEKNIFTTSPTPLASKETIAAWSVAQPLTQPANTEVANALAGRMQRIPALKAFGYSLEGDLQQSRGNTSAAKDAYLEAANIRPTPSVSSRLRRLQRTGAITPQASLQPVSAPSVTQVASKAALKAARPIGDKAAEIVKPSTQATQP